MEPSSDAARPLTRAGPGPVPAGLPEPEQDRRLIVKAAPLPQRLSRRVERHPATALLAAACAGFVVGRLIRLAWRSIRPR